MSPEMFRRFWVEITEDDTELRLEVGRGEDDKAFMSRTWLVGSEPLPWSKVRYVGFSSYRANHDPSFNEMKFISPSKMTTAAH